MREKIITILSNKNKLSLKQIRKEMKIASSSELVSLMKALNELEDERLLLNNHAYYYLLNESDIIGKVKDVSRFEYAVLGAKKIYVEKKNAKNVFDGDEVLAQKDKNGIYKITHIYSHGIYRITGTFIKLKGNLVFHSDVDFHRDFIVKNMKNFKIQANEKAVVTVEKYDNPMIVNIESLLGNSKSAGVDVTAILMQNKARLEFPERVMKEAKAVPQKVSSKEMKGRKDLRFLTTVTIDGDDAMDFDDAISIIKNDEGFKLFVHIADVSHYVAEGSQLDNEAYARCTSIYVADRVVPMLPFELSNGICSLNEAVERNTITCEMNINQEGDIVDYAVYPSVIFSDKRCTYNKVNACIDGDEVAIEEYQYVYPMLMDMAECAKLLITKSQQRGNIEFNSKEPIIVLDKKGRPVDIKVREIGFAENIIEQFMISANICVANLMNSKELPCMYRIHEDPDEEDIQRLVGVANHFGLEFDGKDFDSQSIQRLLDSIDDEMTFEVVSRVALRCMQKARYSSQCTGHFGLSLEEYCHFTSPIRRYSDLVVHRNLRKYVFEKCTNDPSKDFKKVERQSAQMSMKEKDAILMERKVEDYMMAEYMESRIGEIYEATIVSVLEFGFFVELDNLVEGLVSARSLKGYYTFDEKSMSLSNGIITYSMGQKVKVICVETNKEKGQIAFEIALRNSRNKVC